MRNRPLVQLAATAVAATFLLVAVLGFVPGVTTNYSELSFAGHESEAKLVGLFQVSILHNIVHGLFGVIGLALATSVAGARNFLIGGGIVYLVLTVYGSVIDLDSDVNFVPVNVADNFLHLVLGVAMIGLGVVLGKQAAHTTHTRATANSR
jgi:hypothetical protein